MKKPELEQTDRIIDHAEKVSKWLESKTIEQRAYLEEIRKGELIKSYPTFIEEETLKNLEVALENTYRALKALDDLTYLVHKSYLT